MSDGSLAVGTGDGGKIYKVKAANATPQSSLLFDTSETHIISLATDRLTFEQKARVKMLSYIKQRLESEEP